MFVNDKLPYIFLQLLLSEKIGIGVPKIVETYGKEYFEFGKNSIVVKIPFNWINVVGNKVGNKKELTNNRIAILKEFRNNLNVTIAQLANILCISETAIDNNLKYLKEQGYVKRNGSNKTGYWEVLK